MFKKVLFNFFLLILLCSFGYSADPSIKWQINLTNFPVMTSDPHFAGRVCSHPLVYNDKFLLIQPDGTTTTSNFMTPAIVTTHNLADGKEVNRYTSPISRSGFQTSNAGSMDNDVVCGVFWGLTTNNTILAACGGDFPGRWGFDVDTGVAKTINFVGPAIGSGSNSTAAFTSHPNVPYIVSGGSNNHGNIATNSSIHRLIQGTSVPWVGYKQWTVGLIDEKNQAAYRLDDTARTTASAYGTRLWGLNLNHGGVGCEILGWIPYQANGSDGFGFPKPATMLSDGRVAILCSKAIGAGFSTTKSTNSYTETRIVFVSPTPNGKTGMILGFTSWKSLDFKLSDPIPYTDNGLGYAKIIPTDKGVLAFWSPLEGSGGYLCLVGNDGKFIWGKKIPVHKRIYQNYARDNFPRFLTVTNGVVGNEILILEPDAGSLHIRKYDLTTGQTLTTHAINLNLPINPAANFFTIQSVQQVPDGLLLSLLYRANNRTHQTTCLVVNGAVVEPVPTPTPTPIPTPTPTITPEQEVLDFAKTRISAEKYEQIRVILVP